MLKALIFDLNGVLVQSPPLSERFKDKYNIPTETFLPVLKETLAKVRTPEAGSVFSYFQPYLEKWGLKINEKEFLSFWFKVESVVPEIIEMARTAKLRGIKLFILSNNFEERAVYYRANFPFIYELFEAVYYSWQTGFVKPDPQAFTNLLFVNGLTPEECLFIDDKKECVDVARDLGMKAEVYLCPSELRKLLTSLDAI